MGNTPLLVMFLMLTRKMTSIARLLLLSSNLLYLTYDMIITVACVYYDGCGVAERPNLTLIYLLLQAYLFLTLIYRQVHERISLRAIHDFAHGASRCQKSEVPLAIPAGLVLVICQNRVFVDEIRLISQHSMKSDTAGHADHTSFNFQVSAFFAVSAFISVPNIFIKLLPLQYFYL